MRNETDISMDFAKGPLLDQGQMAVTSSGKILIIPLPLKNKEKKYHGMKN